MFNALLHNFRCNFTILSYVVCVNKSITLNTFRFMHPKFSDFFCFLKQIGFSLQYALEHTCEVSNVEFLVEVCRGLFEGRSNHCV